MLVKVRDSLLRFKGLLFFGFLIFAVLGLLSGVPAANGADSTTPKVSSTDPVNNAVEVPGDKVIKVNFNEPVKAGTNWIELERSDGKGIPVTKSIGTKVLTVTPKSLLTHGNKYKLIVHTGSLTDLAGNPVALYTTSFKVDSVAPKVSSTDPKNNAVEVSGDKVIKVNFNEPVKAGTNWVELKNSKGTVIPITKSIGTKVLTVTPKSLLTHGNKYTLAVHTGSLTDMAGNAVALFSTGFKVDSVEPKISSTDPKNNAVQVPGDKVIKIVFNEPIKAGFNWIELKNSNGTVIPITKSIGTKVLTIKPNKLLVHGTKYTLSIHTSSLTDMAGNPVSLYTTSFTVDSTNPTVTASLPSYAYNTAKTVKLTAKDNCDPDPVIYYTLNGASPTTSSTRYTTPLTITKTTTLKFMAVDSAGNVAAVQTRTYIIDKTPPTVTADLETGVYTAKTVTLTATDNVDSYPEIYYTTNGNNPTTSSDIYTSPIILFATTTLKFMAVDYAGNICGVQTRIYTITGINATAPTVTANLKGGIYNTTQTVTLTASDDLDPNPVIYYTTDGSTPTTSSTRYTKPINIVENTILKYIAVDNAGNIAGVQTRNYTINVAHLIIHGPVCWDYLGGVDPYDAFSDPDIFDSMDEDSFGELVVMARVAGYVSSYDTSRPTLENNIRQYMYGFALPRLQRGLELFWVYPSLYIDYVIPLNEPVTAVSVVIKQNNKNYDLQERMEIWINGQLKFTKKFFNYYSPAYSPYYHIDPYNLPIPILGVKDNITISLTYPGGSITKKEGLTYMNKMDTITDINHPETGFEVIQSFAIAPTKVTDNTIKLWLNKKSQYPAGYKKAIYGTFMTALNTLWISDKIASEVSKNLNGTWNRNTSTTVMSGINRYGMAYVHCQDPAMGMKFIGNGQNVKLFRLVCSLMLSEVEHVTLGSAGNSVSSTLSTITSGILEGKMYKIIFNEDNTAVFMLEENQQFKIIIDLETGLVKEIIEADNFQYKGAETVKPGYCYHNQLTEDVNKRTKAFLDAFGWDGVESTGGGLLITAGLIAFGACPPLGIAMLGFGLLLTADASGLTKDPTNPYNWLDFGVSTGLSLAGPGGVTLKQAIQPAFRQGIKLTVKKDGYKTVAHGTLGRNERSAIKTYYNNYITGSSISGLIDMYRPENN